MITYLDFDSKLFGYKVGKVNIDSLQQYQNTVVPTDYTLVYLFSKVELPLYLADAKEVFSRKTQKYTIKECAKSIRTSVYNSNELKKLAFESGVYSRFFRDPNFNNGEFQKLYSIWYQKSIDLEIAWDVLYYKNNNSIDGFITVGETNNQTANIGLLAVNEISRGMGFGKKLIREAISYSFMNGYNEIEVATQGLNLSAISLYSSLEFELKNKIYIYHLWQ